MENQTPEPTEEEPDVLETPAGMARHIALPCDLNEGQFHHMAITLSLSEEQYSKMFWEIMQVWVRAFQVGRETGDPEDEMSDDDKKFLQEKLATFKLIVETLPPDISSGATPAANSWDGNGEIAI